MKIPGKIGLKNLFLIGKKRCKILILSYLSNHRGIIKEKKGAKTK